MGHSAHVHVGGHGDDSSTSTNRFELIAAILLGIAGIFTALASFQAGLWNGRMSQHYGKANTIATAAAAEKSRAIVEMSKDAAVDIQAKQLILEGNENPAAKARTTQTAGYLYVFQLSEPGYKAMGFPEELKKLLHDETDSPELERKQETMLGDVLKKAWETDLSTKTEYRDEMLEKSKEQSNEAEKTFNEGVEAKENSDHFELADVIFAVSLFFTGISLVFRTQIRWSIIVAGGVFLLAGVVYMLTIPWTLS